jgi:hypothetical protein
VRFIFIFNSHKEEETWTISFELHSFPQQARFSIVYLLDRLGNWEVASFTFRVNWFTRLEWARAPLFYHSKYPIYSKVSNQEDPFFRHQKNYINSPPTQQRCRWESLLHQMMNEKQGPTSVLLYFHHQAVEQKMKTWLNGKLVLQASLKKVLHLLILIVILV